MGVGAAVAWEVERRSCACPLPRRQGWSPLRLLLPYSRLRSRSTARAPPDMEKKKAGRSLTAGASVLAAPPSTAGLPYFPSFSMAAAGSRRASDGRGVSRPRSSARAAA